MSTRIVERHQPGSFCWIELATTGQEGAKRFYASLLGWQVQDFPVGENETYSVFSLDGHPAAAVYTMRAALRERGIPPHWMIYIAVENVDAAERRAGELGATVLAPAFDVLDVGRMAVIRDPAGAVFSIWQPKRHPGFTVMGENAFCWAELSTGDFVRAGEFYGELFDWKIVQSPGGSGYAHIENGGATIGGIQPPAHRDPESPPQWLIWLAAADCDGMVKAAEAAGARALMGPMRMEKIGRLAIVADPQGAVFGILTSVR